MSDFLESIFDRLALFMPSALTLLVLYLLLHFLYLWRCVIWNDRLLGIINDDRKGEAPLSVTLSMAAIQLWPFSRLEFIHQWWLEWIDRRYGPDEPVGVEGHRQMVNRAGGVRQIKL